jgi:hypothetical protein
LGTAKGAASLPPELVATQFGPVRPRRATAKSSFPAWAAALILVALTGSSVAAYRFWPPSNSGRKTAPSPGAPAEASRPPSGGAPAAAADVAAEAVSANRDGNQLYQRALAEEDMQRRNGYLREAIKAYYHASQLAPGYAAPLRGLGMCYQTRGEPGDSDLAAAHYRKYLESVPTPLDAAAVRQQLAGLNGG